MNISQSTKSSIEIPDVQTSDSSSGDEVRLNVTSICFDTLI